MATTFKLPPRYEIRKLTPEHKDWVKAIICHSNIFYSPVWSVVYTDGATQRTYDMYSTCDYHVMLGISSGLSYGVFDTEYVFKQPSSAATGGAVHWDLANPAATGDDLLAQMDFPLVSFGLAYDAFNEMDMAQQAEFLSHLPHLGTLIHHLDVNDPRPEVEKKPTAAGQIVIRNGTATRGGYEGRGLAKGLAHRMMRELAEAGYKTIQCDSAARQVDHIWRNPPAPFTAVVTNSFETAAFEMEGEGGEKVNPFAPADVWCARMVVSLK